MYKKLLLMCPQAILGAVFVFIHLGFALLFTLIYFFTLGLLVFIDSKSILKTLLYQIIPLILLIGLFPFLHLIDALGEPETPYKMTMTFSFGTLVYLTPMISYIIYVMNKKKVK